MTRRTLTLTLDQGTLDLAFDVQGDEDGHPVLLLHGGGGPQTVSAFAGLLAGQRPVRVFTPVHPGFEGTARPDWLADIRTLAQVYARLLDALGAERVIVVGNSIGGWTAAELAVLGSDRIDGVILVNATGIEVPGHPIADPFALTPVELSRLSFHDPSKFRFDPSALSEEQRAVAAANRAALQVYAGPSAMADPTLRGRLAEVAVPALVAWGASDRVVDVDYGRAYAEAIPGAEFRLLNGTGHMPQIETPEEFLPVVWDFIEARAVDHR